MKKILAILALFLVTSVYAVGTDAPGAGTTIQRLPGQKRGDFCGLGKFRTVEEVAECNKKLNEGTIGRAKLNRGVFRGYKNGHKFVQRPKRRAKVVQYRRGLGRRSRVAKNYVKQYAYKTRGISREKDIGLRPRPRTHQSKFSKSQRNYNVSRVNKILDRDKKTYVASKTYSRMNRGRNYIKRCIGEGMSRVCFVKKFNSGD